ncbi:MAG TPA: sigma-70 family RNA polymerase sigma factor [Ilumatobacter sp.]
MGPGLLEPWQDSAKQLGSCPVRRKVVVFGEVVGMDAGARGGAGSVARFAAFYDVYFDEVFRYLCRGMLGDRARAEDLTQDTFAAAAAAARAGREEAMTVTWVMGIARHKLIDCYRRSDREQRALARVAALPVRGGDGELVEGISQVIEAMRSLRREHQLVLVLRYLDEQSISAIAAHIDRSEHATESLLARARRALSGCMSEARP